MQKSITQKDSIWKAIKVDNLLLLCLFISVTQLFLHWYEIFFAIPLFILVAVHKQSKQCKNTVAWLIVFSVLFLFGHYLHSGIESRTLFLIYLFPPIYYMTGSYLGRKYKTNETVLVFILFVVVVMYAAYDLGFVVRSIFSGGGVLTERQILDQNGNETRTATGYAILMSVLIAGISLIISPRQQGINQWIRIIGVSLGFLALYGMMTIVTRTSLFESVLVLIFSVYMFIFERNMGKKKKGGMLVFLLVVASLAAITFYVFEHTSLSIIGDVFNAFEARNTEGSQLTDAGGRTSFWVMGIEDLLSHPFGTSTGRIRSGTYSHNMWLDIGVTAGWIPFIIILIVSIKNTRDCIRLVRDQSYDYFTRLYYFAMFICLMMSCFVEPVLDNVFRHFLVYLFFCGMVSEMRPKTSEIISQ